MAKLKGSLNTTKDGVFENGLNVGFSGGVVSDQIRIGDADFSLDYSAGDPKIFYDGADNDYQDYIRATNTFRWVIGNSEVMSASSSLFKCDGDTFNIDLSNNRVGIGTSSPSSVLDVVGTTEFNDGVTCGISAQFGVGMHGDADGNLYLSAQSSDKITFRPTNASDTDAMILDGSGNLGVGTTTPGAKLHVDGNIKIKNSSTTVITLTPNALNTIVHNLNITGTQIILAMNGDYSANGFVINGVNIGAANSFQFYAAGGGAGPARINWAIFTL